MRFVPWLGRKDEPAANPMSLCPSLQEACQAEGLNELKLMVWFPGAHDKNQPPRETISISDGAKVSIWKVPSLGGLFRGDRPNPGISNDGRPPADYLPFFEFIEYQVLEWCDEHGDKSDGEFEEVFRQLRRRPDGRSLGPLHDHLWQVAALMLGMFPLSQGEHEAIFHRLTHSASAFRMGPVSRNYVAALRMM